MKQRFTKLFAAFALLVFMMPSMAGWGQTTPLFHETFGNNSGSARDWNDSYSVKSGIATVYSDVAYAMTNLKQSKNTVGHVQSGLIQTTQGTDAVFEFGPLHVADYTNMSLDYYWKAASIKATYSTSIYYKTSETGSYTEIEHSAQGATTFVEVNVNLPVAAQTNTLFLKIVWNTSNTQALIDEVELRGEANSQSSDPVLTIVNPTGGTVAVSYNGVNVSSGNQIPEGTPLTLSNTPEAAYTFDSYNVYETGNEANTVTVTDGTFNMPDFDVTVSAVFNQKPVHSITLTTVNNGEISSNPQGSAYEGQTVTLTASANQGYEFVTWSVTGATVVDATSATTTFVMGTQNVTVSAEFALSTNVVDELTGVNVYAAMPTAGTGYKSWTLNGSNAVYKGQSNYTSDYIQLRNQTPSGIVTTISGGKVKKVEVTFLSNTTNGRKITVYGKNQPYTSSADLYDEAARGTELGTIIKGANTQITVSGKYSYIGLLANGALYVEPIKITWEPDDAVATTTTINVPQGFNTDIHQGTNAGTLTATVMSGETQIEGATVTWESSNVDVATINANGAVNLVAAGTTIITASYAGAENEFRPSEGTYELTVIDSYAPGTVNNPYTVAQAIQNTPATGVYIRGKVSSFYNNNIMGDGNAYRYNISDDGTTTTEIRVYKGKDLNQNDFNNVNDVLVGDEVVLYGSLNEYQGVHQVISSYIVSQVRTCSRTILGYDNSNNTNYGGFYLIASPIEGVAPANVTGMTGDNFDLYRFNESAELEWENWKQEGDHNHFNLESGKGYLYAHKTDVTLTFSGTPYTGDGVIPLSYTSGAQFAGWNLVGNPFGVAADVEESFYVIGTTTGELIASDATTVSTMEGIFVEASGTEQSVTFTPQVNQGGSGNKTNAVVLNLTRNRGDVIDRAIVRFGEGSQLHKFQLRENSTKVYFTEDNQDFAVVRSQKAQGEMPVNFKAEENGTYTLSVNTEEMELNYLHLIDNMTGMDVDLLQTPSYTFDATTNDYASRFRLVFSANGMNENGETETFAFFSNGNWVVNNEGEATLQVIDVNGRIVSNETINGTVATSINATPGVYMLRLVNGNEVKTQKIVVR